jgi:hypothetical protein
MRLPFGKFKGQEVASLDRSYLAWLQENCKLRGPLAGEISRILNPPIPDDQIEEYRHAICQVAKRLDKKRLAKLYGYVRGLLNVGVLGYNSTFSTSATSRPL